MSTRSKEFQEIAHCGGRVTFHVKTDETGHRRISISWQHSAPNAAAITAVYALPQGVAVAPLDMGGLGDPWPPPPVPGCFPVMIASDSEGLFGCQCPQCKGYWRSEPPTMCPYCALRVARHQFLTDAQRRYVQQYCERLGHALDAEADDDHVIDMDAVADAVGKDAPKPPFYYTQESQQTKYKCRACLLQNDIIGKYGYCSLCGVRNDLQQLDADLKDLRDRINSGAPCENAVKDAVALFDSFAGNYASELLRRTAMTPARRRRMEKQRFHNLGPVKVLFLEIFDIDILDGIGTEEASFLTLMFHRRHVYEHTGGVVDEKYLEDSGDSTVRLRQAIREDKDSAHRTISGVRKIAANLHRGFHTIIPPKKDHVRTDLSTSMTEELGLDE